MVVTTADGLSAAPSLLLKPRTNIVLDSLVNTMTTTTTPMEPAKYVTQWTQGLDLPANKLWRPLPSIVCPSEYCRLRQRNASHECKAGKYRAYMVPEVAAIADAGTCGILLGVPTYLCSKQLSWTLPRTQIVLCTTAALYLCMNITSYPPGHYRRYLPWTAGQREQRSPNEPNGAGTSVTTPEIATFAGGQLGLIWAQQWIHDAKKRAGLPTEFNPKSFVKYFAQNPLRIPRSIGSWIGVYCIGSAFGNGVHHLWWQVRGGKEAER